MFNRLSKQEKYNHILAEYEIVEVQQHGDVSYSVARIGGDTIKTGFRSYGSATRWLLGYVKQEVDNL